MKLKKILFLYDHLFSFITILIYLPCILNQKRNTPFTNEWAVQVNGNESVAKELAQKYGFIYHSKVII